MGGMGGTADTDWMKRGRFDQSFVVRMIIDFFLVLLLVAVAELGLRFVVLVHDFYTNEERITRTAAEHLASDVRQIMINTGGPVAARTVYPILKRAQEESGLMIAVEPSDITIESIEDIFDFTPEGIPTAWPSGIHHQSRIDIKADDFCLSCHVEARTGDVLGSVEVRNYLSTHVGHWWQEVRLTAVMSLFKILLHSMILFFLLKVRMEPLLSLRAVVSGLTKGGTDLTLRAPVRSLDEFGELATDLNHFLDRISHIIEDLHSVLGRIGSLNLKMEALQGRMTDAVHGMRARLDACIAGEGSLDDPALEQEFRNFELLLADMSLQEEKMSHIAETARKLVDRLKARPEQGGAGAVVPNEDSPL